MTGTPAPTGKTTRVQRMAMPLAREVVKDLAVEHGACIRPIQLRRTNLDTGETEPVLVPCGHTLGHVCPRTPAPVRSPAPARAKPTTAITSATPDGGCCAPASGPAKPWATTAPTARNGSCGPSVFRQPTPPRTPGNWSFPLTRITWTTRGGCSTSSRTGSDGRMHSPKPDAGPRCHQTVIFRQPGGLPYGEPAR